MAHLRSGLGAFVVLGVLALGTSPAVAQESDADGKAVEGHRLSVDLIKRATVATLALNRAEKTAPESGETPDDEMDGESIIDELVKRLESTAWQAAALKSARITARDYALTLIVIAEAEMAIESMAQGTLPEPAPSWLMRDIAFMKAHPKEIQALADSLR
jgi:hypothetical protein